MASSRGGSCLPKLLRVATRAAVRIEERGLSAWSPVAEAHETQVPIRVPTSNLGAHMNFKHRGNRVSLYRSTWVPKGPETPHGYARQTYIGSVAENATVLPPNLASQLTQQEVVSLEERILRPAKLRREASVRQAAQRELDPLWRLDDALQLVAEAAERSLVSPVKAARTQLLRSALEGVKTVDGVAGSPRAAVPSEPLLDALKAIALAAEAIRQGRYGRGPKIGARKTSVFRQWVEILAAIDGGDSSLLRALQDTGFASRRKR